MNEQSAPIPVWQLYGEDRRFPDVMHVERIADRAAGLEWRIAPHRHLHLHQVMLLMSGAPVLTIDGTTHRPDLPVCLNLPRDCVHGFHFSAGTDGYVLTLPIADFPELFGPDAPTAAAARRPFLLPPEPQMAGDMARIERVYLETSPYRTLTLRGACIALLSGMLAAAEGQPGARAAPGPADVRIGRFLGLIRRNGRSRWSVADYAAALALSPRQLGRLCHEAGGQSPKAMIEAETMREACRLLVYTRMSVQAVAWHLGFDDPSHFSRRFRAATGLSARAYRSRFE